MELSRADVILTQLRDGRWQVNRYGRRMLVGSAAQVVRYFDTKVDPAASVEVRLPHEVQMMSPLGATIRLEGAGFEDRPPDATLEALRHNAYVNEVGLGC